MVNLGIHIVPLMPVGEVVETIIIAEELGYEYCLVCDEGFMADVYVTLGMAAAKTSRIRLGPVTNGYTRHPAVTATALATLNVISNGRAFVNLVAGGTMVLNPMGIPRETPVTVAHETIRIMRKLWSGENITWKGERYSLENAQTNLGLQDIPIWVGARGEKMLDLTGRLADGAIMMVKADLENAFGIVDRSAAAANRQVKHIYLDRIAYTDDLMKEAALLYSFVILDSPPRIQKMLGLTNEDLENIRIALDRGGGEEAARFITTDMIRRYQIAGTLEECKTAIREVVSNYNLDIFMLNIPSGGLKENTRLMKDFCSIMADL